MGRFIQNVFKKPMNLFPHPNHRGHSSLYIEWDFPVAQMVQNLPAMQETLVLSLGREEPLEKGMPFTPGFLPGESHGKRSLAGYSPWGCKESGTIGQLRLNIE